MTDERLWTDLGDTFGRGNEICWLFESPDGDRVAVKNPQWEPDNDDDGYTCYYPSWDKITVIEPDGERDATEDEKDDWYDALRDLVREGLHNST